MAMPIHEPFDTLTNLTLAGIILDEVDMTSEERDGIASLLRDCEKSV